MNLSKKKLNTEGEQIGDDSSGAANLFHYNYSIMTYSYYNNENIFIIHIIQEKLSNIKEIFCKILMTAPERHFIY